MDTSALWNLLGVPAAQTPQQSLEHGRPANGAARCMVSGSSRLVSGMAYCALALHHLSCKMGQTKLLLLRSWCAPCAAKIEVAEHLPVCASWISSCCPMCGAANVPQQQTATAASVICAWH